MKLKSFFPMIIRFGYATLFNIYFIFSLFFPEKYFADNLVCYKAFVDKINISKRFTKLADLCNYNQQKLFLWLSFFCFVWNLENTYKIDEIHIELPALDPPY